MKWLAIILLFCTTGTFAQELEPNVITVMKTRLHRSSTPKCKNSVRYVSCRYPIVIGKVPVPVVDLNVDKPTRYKWGIHKLEKSLRDSIQFTINYDLTKKDVSVYRLRLHIDSLGIVTAIDYVSGKKDDMFYDKLIKQLMQQQHWKNAIIEKKATAYCMPIEVLLKPRLVKNTYQIKINKPLRVKTVF